MNLKCTIILARSIRGPCLRAHGVEISCAGASRSRKILRTDVILVRGSYRKLVPIAMLVKTVFHAIQSAEKVAGYAHF